MDPSKENDDKLTKKLLDDKQSANDPFYCVNCFQYLSSCCFLLYA